MLFKQVYTFQRINQDLAPDKRDSSTHLNIQNMEVFLTSRGASLQVAKGPKEMTSGNATLAGYTVIGHGTIVDELYIFVTEESGSNDAIMKVDITLTTLILTVVQSSTKWNFSVDYPIEAIGIRENENSKKLYWVDAFNQARFINVLDPTEDVDFVLANPTPGIISTLPYGVAANKEAVVRYAYTQYNIGGSESKLSPLSNPINISPKRDSARINISGLSPAIYEAYRIYRVMWESYGGPPTYAIVAEGVIDSEGSSVTLIDGGDLFVTSISIEEFIDIGSDLFVPETITAKKQRLFFGNYKIEPFSIEDDVRAFSFGLNSTPTYGAPEAIPPDANVEYIPIYADDRATYGYVEDYLIPNSISGTVCANECVPGMLNYVEFTIDENEFYFNKAPGTENLIMMLWEKDQVDRDPLKRLMHEPVYITNTVLKVSGLSSTGYRGIIAPGRILDSPTYIELQYSANISQRVHLGLSKVFVPDIGGYSYTGVTGFLDTTEIKWRLDNGSVYSTYAPITVTDNTDPDYTLFTVDYPTGLIIDGKPAPKYVKLWPYVKADPTGTRKPLTSGAFKVKNAGETLGQARAFASFSTVDRDHDGINPDYDTYKYTANSSVLGAEGPLVKLEWIASTNFEEYGYLRKFKMGEFYRIGIVFYDKYGRSTPAMWVADLKVPYNNGGNSTDGRRYFYDLKGSIKKLPAGAVSFKFVYVKREHKDKTILFQGIVQPVMEYSLAGEFVGLYPFPNMKEVKGNGTSATTTTFSWFDVRTGYNPNQSVPEYCDWSRYGTGDLSSIALHDTSVNMVYTPETHLYKTDLTANSVRIVGLAKINPAKDKTRFEFVNPSASNNNIKKYTLTNANAEGGIQFSQERTFQKNNEGNYPDDPIPPNCLFDSYPNEDQEADSYSINMYYRAVNDFYNSTMTESSIEDCKYLAVDSTTVIGANVISNAIDEYAFAGSTGNSHPCRYQAEFSDCFVLNMTDADWAGTVNYSDFLTPVAGGSTLGANDRGFPIVEVLQNLSAQYGGGSLETKSTNIYIDASEGSTQINTPVTLYGDIYNGLYHIPKSTSARVVAYGHNTSVFDYVTVALESEVNMDFANTVLKEVSKNFDGATAGNLKVLEVKNLLSYNHIFSQVPNAVLSIAKPFNYVYTKQYLARITPSLGKVTGEVIDNWTKVVLGTYMDLDSPYGAIIKLLRVKDSVIAFQERAIVYISVFPEKQVQTGTGSIQLAKGGVLDNFKYISINSGTENKQTIAVWEDKIFFIDTVNKTLNALSEGEVSTLKGFNSIVSKHMTREVKDYLSEDNPYGGFTVINNNLKQVLFKFSATFPALAYNFITQQFVGTRTYTGTYFLTFNNYVISSKNSKLYIHDHGAIGDYYGESKPALIEMFIEPVPGKDKIFDAVQVLKNGEGNFDMIKVESPTRSSGENMVPLVFKSKYDLHTAQLPRVENSRDRFRERNIKLTLEYNGTAPLEVDEITLKFSVKK